MSVNLAEVLNDQNYEFPLITNSKLMYPLGMFRGFNSLPIYRSPDEKLKDFNDYPFIKLLNISKPLMLMETETGLCELIRKGEITEKKNEILSCYDQNKLKLQSFKYIIPDILELVEYLEIFNHYDEPKIDSKTCKLRDPESLLLYINAWLKCSVNQIYLEYCKNNNVIPKGIISIPEHLIHHVFLSESREKLMERVDYVLSKYILLEESDFGTKVEKVYFNCYEKALQHSLNQIETSINNVWRPSDLIPDYRDQEPVKFTYAFSENSRKHIQGDLERRLGEMVHNWLTHPKDRVDVNILIDNDKSSEIINGRKQKREYYDDVEGVVLHSDSRHPIILHETTHRVLNHGYSKASNTICDFIFEKTKGSMIQQIPFWKEDEFYKPIIENLPLDNYATRIYTAFEKYSCEHEMITWLFSDLLLDKKAVDWRKIIIQIKEETCNSNIKECMDEALKVAFKNVQEKFKENFDLLCGQFPELGALVLSYLKK